MEDKPLNAVGVSVFAGGFSLGVREYFNVLAHFEHGTYGHATAKLNFPETEFRIGTENWLKPPLNEAVDFIFSNPPCAPWSSASHGRKIPWHKDPRLQLIKDIFFLLPVLKPKVWAWESVCQAWTKGRPFVERLIDAANKLGYSTTVVLLDAQYLGVAQKRRRFFLVIHNVEIPWIMPDFSKILTSGDVLDTLDPGEFRFPMSKRDIDLIPHVPPGQSLRGTFDKRAGDLSLLERNKHGEIKGRPSFLSKRLHHDLPAPTVIGGALYHYKEDRLLTPNEISALSGFPPSWKWPSAQAMTHEASRGVCPPVGMWLAANAAFGIRKDKKILIPTNEVFDIRKPPGQRSFVNLHTFIEEEDNVGDV